MGGRGVRGYRQEAGGVDRSTWRITAWRRRRFVFCLPQGNSLIERQVEGLERGKAIAIPQVGGLHCRYHRAKRRVKDSDRFWVPDSAGIEYSAWTWVA